MALLGELFSEVFQELEEGGLFNPDFTWGGSTWKCVPNASAKSARLEAGGFGVEEDLVLYCRTDQFSTLPSRGQTLTRDSTEYRIERVTTAPDGAFLRLGCVNISRGA
jgi:hypothetical protein